MKATIAALALTAILAAAAVHAADPAEMLPDPALEKRAETLGKDLRCLVCQNESIEDSNADLAHDLRVIVRERIQAGATDDQVRQYVVDRYGDYVLLRPPFKLTTLALWLGPVLLLAGAIAAAIAVFRRRGTAGMAAPAVLTPEERRRLDALLKDHP